MMRVQIRQYIVLLCGLWLLGCANDTTVPQDEQDTEPASTERSENALTLSTPVVLQYLWNRPEKQMAKIKKAHKSILADADQQSSSLQDFGVWEARKGYSFDVLDPMLSEDGPGFPPFYTSYNRNKKALYEGGVYNLSIVVTRLLEFSSQQKLRNGLIVQKFAQQFPQIQQVEGLPFPPNRDDKKRADLPTTLVQRLEIDYKTYTLGVFCWGSTRGWPLPQDVVEFTSETKATLAGKPARTSLEGNTCELWLVPVQPEDRTTLEYGTDRNSYLLLTEVSGLTNSTSVDGLLSEGWRTEAEDSVSLTVDFAGVGATFTGSGEVVSRNLQPCANIKTSQQAILDRANEWFQGADINAKVAVSDGMPYLYHPYAKRMVTVAECADLQVILTAVNETMDCKINVARDNLVCDPDDFSQILSVLQ